MGLNFFEVPRWVVILALFWYLHGWIFPTGTCMGGQKLYTVVHGWAWPHIPLYMDGSLFLQNWYMDGWWVVALQNSQRHTPTQTKVEYPPPPGICLYYTGSLLLVVVVVLVTMMIVPFNCMILSSFFFFFPLILSGCSFRISDVGLIISHETQGRNVLNSLTVGIGFHDIAPSITSKQWEVAIRNLINTSIHQFRIFKMDNWLNFNKRPYLDSIRDHFASEANP